MKILVISHMYPSSFNEVGGIFVNEQVKALVKKGVEIRVVSPVPWAPFPVNRISRKWNAYHNIPDKTNLDSIDVHYPRYIAFPRLLFFASSGKRMSLGIKCLVESVYDEFRFDLIHAHVALPDGFAALAIKQKYQRPLVVTVHGQDLQVTLYRNKKCKSALRSVFGGADKVIAVSSKVKKIAEKDFGFLNGRVVTVGNGVPVQDLKCHAKVSSNMKSKFKIILSVSNLVKLKGIDINLKAFAQLASKYPNIKYLIIGDGAEKKALERLSRDLGIDRQVSFLGRLPHAEVFSHMATADIFSLPSWNEAFGVVYIEAMACGKAVIGCRGQGIEDFVQSGETGLLVKPRDVNSLLSALDFLLSNPEEARAIGNQARKVVLENYTWEKNAERTIKVYEEVLRGR